MKTAEVEINYYRATVRLSTNANAIEIDEIIRASELVLWEACIG
jgi:hypothetical protein